MSNVKWIRLNVNMFEDEKIRLIETLPEADTILVIWVKLLAQAGKTNATGYIYLNENIPYTDEMIATIFNRPIATVRLALNTFQQFGMIDILDNNFISICNWERHQNVDGLEKIRQDTKLRVQRFRDKQKQVESNVTCNATETQGNATEEEENKKKKDIYSPAFEQFWLIYPRKVDKKKAYKSFNTAIKNHSLQTILNGTEKYAQQVQHKQKDYIKHPATFLNNDSFIDGYEEVEESKPQYQQTQQESILAGIWGDDFE